MSFFSTSSSAADSKVAAAATAAATTLESTTTTGATTNQKSPHYHFIHSMILPSTVKIQKELKGRKFKEVQLKLTEAITVLKSFQLESWTPPVVPEVTAVASRDKEGKNHDDSNSQQQQYPPSFLTLTSSSEKEEMNGDNNDNGDGDEEATATTQTTDATDNNPNSSSADDAAAAVAGSTANTSRSSTAAAAAAATIVVTTEDDPFTKIPMHASIQVAVDAYILTISHELIGKSIYKIACQEALECLEQLVIREYITGRAGGRDDPTGSGSVAVTTRTREQHQEQQRNNAAANGNGVVSGGGGAAAAGGSGSVSQKNISVSQLHQLLEGLHKCSESATKMPTIHSHIARTTKAIMTSPRCGIHEASMLLGIRIVFHSYLVSNDDSCRIASKEAALDIIEYMLRRLETDTTSIPISSSLWYTDCFYMYRSLVKLSSKEISGIDENTTKASVLQQKTSFFSWDTSSSSNTVDPLALHNKILSLELQVQAMECAGSTFCNGEKFIQLIQSQNGSIALFKNCMSQCTQVAYVSQQVFLIMCYKFKSHIRDEIQAFMSNIFFKVLESENSAFSQKALVLESLRSICNDPFLLSQLFLNYDCDLDSMNLYKDIVFHLAQLCGKSTMMSMDMGGSGGGGGGRSQKLKDVVEHTELSLAGCEVLVTILQAFLKALNIQVSESDTSIDIAGKKIRKDLNIEDVRTSGARRSLNFRRSSMTNNNNVRSSIISTNNAAATNGGTTTKTIDNDDGVIVEAVSREGSEDDDDTDAAAAAAADDVTGTILGFFEKKRNAEQNLELGVVKFTMDMKKGLQFFIENGFVKCDAKSIALFFLTNKDRLDKTQMGEALGREPDAAFIKKPADLDPEKGGKGFFLRILSHYIGELDFTDMRFDIAIRLFLSGFRLPGEAQKIDRIMEKFAERYTLKNPDIFPSADTAFILAFSVIMLNTDLHNPSIKEERRMTIDSFLRNNRGIGDNGTDLPKDFLTGIFVRIKEEPFSLKEDDAAREKVAEDTTTNILGDNGGLLGAGLFGTTSEERKKAKFKKEREDMVQATELLIRRKKGRKSKSENLTDAVDPAHVVKPMFDVTWGAIIGTLSQVMECSNDERSIAVCLSGFVYAIRISSHSNMSLARDTFLGSLAKFTYLGSVKELKYKNIETIRTLINIAITDGEYLGESWGPVLQCISQLARMRMSASGLDTDESFLQDSTHSGTSPAKKESSSSSSRSMFARETKADALKETETTNSRIVLNAISEQLIDQVFSSSTKLSAHSLALFIEQLIAVANSEIEGDSKSGITGVSTSASGSNHGEAGPSVFSMQRLVEVADYNMHVRPRFVWAQIWDTMAKFFTKNGCHNNPMVSVFAVDALKQLSLKFLEKPEVSDFHFQRLFLQPFLLIMESPDTRQETKEIILACVDQMINTRAVNLKSGWRIFFDILTVAANDKNNKVSIHSLNILQGTLDKHLDTLSILICKDNKEEIVLICKDNKEEIGDDDDAVTFQNHRNSNAEDFLGMCRASLSFIAKTESSHPIGVSMRALCHAAIYADLIASKRILPPLSGSQFSDSNSPGYTYEGLDEKEALEMVLWRTLLEGLAEGVRTTSQSREGGVGNLIQRGSVLALRAILLRHGSIFSDDQLSVVLKETILPSFQEAVENDTSPVTSITSESPSLSSLDFLAAPLPIPPDCDDDGLLKFEHVSRQSDRNPRSMGPAELLLEATFTDMRNGGGGDLSEAYKFAKKDMESRDDEEQPFPDSWVSTTAPIALGTLTDLSTEVMLIRGAKGATLWRSTVGDIYQQWCNGDITKWVPCEAVVRIATSELERLMKRVMHDVTEIDTNDSKVWANEMVGFYAAVLQNNLEVEQEMMDMLLGAKFRALNTSSSSDSTQSNGGALVAKGLRVKTDFGAGTLQDKRSIADVDGKKMVLETIQLEYGILFRPKFETARTPRTPRLSVETFAKLDSKFSSPDSPEWMKLLPALKLRCVAAHYLQQILLSLREEELIGFISKETISDLLKTLNISREFAEDAVKNEDIAHAFQEAMLSDWGLNEDSMGEEALDNIARLNNTQGSAMFFLTQTAGATNGVIRFLSALYDHNHEEIMHSNSSSMNVDGGEELPWDRRIFAGQYLSNIMQDIFFKFAESESREGHKVDPNVWRNTNESGVKVAIYCTSFASVVVGLLQAMLSFEPSLIERNKAAFFPMVCELVGVQSEEIRRLVRRVLTEKFGPLLGLGQDTSGQHRRRRPTRSSVDSTSTLSR